MVYRRPLIALGGISKEGARGYQMSSLGIIALTPSVAALPDKAHGGTNEQRERLSLAHASIAVSACRAGATGVLNLEFASITPESDKEIAAIIAQLVAVSGHGGVGIKLDITQIAALSSTMSEVAKVGSERGTVAADTRTASPAKGTAKLPQEQKLPTTVQTSARPLTVIVAGCSAVSRESFKKNIQTLRQAGALVFVEVLTQAEAIAAEECGAEAVIAKGHEAGGRIGEQTTFVLVQQCVTSVKIPVWAEGGIGIHTAAACYAAGCAGVVLDSQLYLTPDSPLPLAMKQKVATMDGTETTIVGNAASGMYRVYSRSHVGHVEVEASVNSESKETNPQAKTEKASANNSSQTREWLLNKLADNAALKPLDRTYVFGQDIAFAADLAKKFTTVAGIIHAIQEGVSEHVELAIKHKSLAPKAPLAVSHGTEFPIVQGAMTRVSDCAEFALKVSEGGALPFLALSLMRQGEVEKLLDETNTMLGKLPWGVGILGFVPQQLRQEQLSAISKFKPPYALIAGGRPDQAKQFEDMGIKTYLHVPSPLLLESFIEMGSRRFIFEGRECGGHVGPRSSFVLWEAMVEKLLTAIAPKEDASKYHVLFAGGVHDGLSASMVSALAAPLAARGVCVGALMGTAYLFTREAVETGAIVSKFQEQALSCDQTVLLETGPGHAIRCINSPYKRTFDERRGELVLQGKSRDEVREELELMNLGRLRVASKGLTRAKSIDRQAVMSEINNTQGEKKDSLTSVSDQQQWSEGMYMIGQVAAMRDQVCTIRELHEQVSQGCEEQLETLAATHTSALAEIASISVPARKPGDPIAIVGMSCLFPKASDVNTYWDNILNKVDTIEEVPINQWDWRNYYDQDALARDKISSKWGGFLEDIRFDATRYGIPPSSLASIDPMQLLILEVTRNALDDAGYTERHFERQKASVIVANAGHGPITALYSLRSMLGWKLADLDQSIKTELEDSLPEWTEDTFPGYLRQRGRRTRS